MVKYIICIAALCCFSTSCSLLQPEASTCDEVIGAVYSSAEQYYFQYGDDIPFLTEYKESLVQLANAFGGYKSNVPMSLRKERTSIVDWVYNYEAMGDSYTGYYIIYSVNIDGRNIYVLLDLVEFDESGRYEASVVAIEKSISVINSYLE